jgi:hypothetical protein
MGAEQKIEAPTGLALLRQPFPPNQISKLPKPYKKDSPKGKCSECGGYHGLPAVHLDYVGHAALTDRLLDADPNWSWEPVGTTPEGLPALGNGGLWIKLTVCGVTRYGFGAADGKSGGDAVKEMIGDALRNAAMRFGAALDLWHKGDLHADEDDTPAAKVQPKADPVPEPVTTMITDGQIKVIRDLLPMADMTEDALKERLKAGSLADITEATAASAIKKLEVTIKAKRVTVEDILDDEVPY